MTWFKNGVRLVPSQRHQMTHSNNIATLKIRNIQPADSGHFTLFAENAAGCIVSTACLAVEPSSPPVKASNGVQQLQQQQRPRPVAQEPATKMARTVSQERQPQQEVVEETPTKALGPQFVRVPADQEVGEGKN